MKRLLFTSLLLSLAGSSFAANEVNVHAVSIGSKWPTEGMDASVFGNGHFVDVRSASRQFGGLVHTYKVKGDNPDTTKASRVARKLLYGVGMGTFTFFILALSHNGFEWCDDNSPEDCGELTKKEKSSLVLLPISVAMGVSASDQRDRFIYPLAASLLGFGLSIAYDDDFFTPMCISVLTATVASEWSRDRADSRRYSIGLRSEPGGGLSMVAALRFQ